MIRAEWIEEDDGGETLRQPVVTVDELAAMPAVAHPLTADPTVLRGEPMPLKPVVSLVLIVALLPRFDLPVLARAQTASQIKETAEVKDSIESHGIGPKAKLTITTRDGTKVKGYISETRDESFTITNPQTKETTSIAFADVADVDKPFPRWATYAIVGGVGWVVTGLLLFFGVVGPGVG